jgi:mRNA-degrading endonuclease toxin of MazEF toxin-antitoxin module
VNVTQLLTIDRSRLTDLVGSLRGSRLRQVRRGLALVLGAESEELGD